MDFVFPEPIVRPWSCINELRHVYDLLYSSCRNNQRLGANIVMIWRGRVGQHRVPRGILLTAEITMAMTCSDSCTAEAAQSLALIRFVTLASGEEQDRTKLSQALPVHSTAAAIGIPLWLVNARHDIVHGQLPGAALIHSGCLFSLQWLNDHFWYPILTDLETVAGVRHERLVQLQNCLENYYREEIDAVRNRSSSTSSTLQELRQLLVHQYGGLATREAFIEELLSSRCLLNPAGFSSTWKLNTDFCQVWFSLFKLLYEYNLLHSLVETILMSVKYTDDETLQSQRLIREWSHYWLKSMQKSFTSAKFPLSNVLRDIYFELCWPRIFHHIVLEELCPAITNLVGLVIELHHPKLTAAEKKRLLEINEIYLSSWNTCEDVDIDTNICDDTTIQTSKVGTDNLWIKDSDFNWSSYPLGSAPSFAFCDKDWNLILEFK